MGVRNTGRQKERLNLWMEVGKEKREGNRRDSEKTQKTPENCKNPPF
jgi:hypothetical protein